MSAELESLGQLLAGDTPLTTIRQLYSKHPGFEMGILGLLNGGDVRLFDVFREVPRWNWGSTLRTSTDGCVLSITPQGAMRVS
jgi:hypothetical protein